MAQDHDVVGLAVRGEPPEQAALTHAVLVAGCVKGLLVPRVVALLDHPGALVVINGLGGGQVLHGSGPFCELDKLTVCRPSADQLEVAD